MKSTFTCEQLKNCSSTITKWIQPFSSGIRLSLLLFLACIFSSNLKAQIVIDGNPGDWANFTTNPLYPTQAYRQDKNSTDDNQFSEGSKDGNAISSWSWTNGQTNNKGDISNAGAILTNVGGHNILYFCGDRVVNNGNASIGFWFFKTTVAVVGTTSGTFSGTHANGDLLVLSNFTQGGGQSNILVYKWLNGGLTGPTTYTTAMVNTGTPNVPAGFTYPSTTYPIGDFFEGSIDLTVLQVAPCFTNFLLETRNSQSITASLQDFAFASFSQTVTPPTTTGAARCGSGSVTLSASGCTGGTLNWYDAPTGGNLVHTGTSFTVNITGTVTYYVSCTTADGCLSARTPVTATLNPIPTVVAGATPAGSVSLASAPPHYTLSTTVNSIVSNSGFNYAWTQAPPTGGSLSSTSIPNPTFTATIADTYQWTVTATDKVTGCFNSSSVTRSIASQAGCPTISDLTVCAGGTGTITASAIPANTHYDWSIVSPANGATITSAVTHDVTSINIKAGTADFTVKVEVSYDNTNLPHLQTCTKVVKVNPNATGPNVTLNPISCTDVSFSVTVTNPEDGSTYSLTQMSGGITPSPITFHTGDPNPTFTGLTLGKGYSVIATTSAGCASLPTQCGTFSARTTTRSPITINQIQQEVASPTVTAAPNPFNDKIRFSLKSPVSGDGSLELYNMLGQKVNTVYQGHIEKGMVKTIDYNVPVAQRANLIYRFRVANHKISGVLIGLK